MTSLILAFICLSGLASPAAGESTAGSAPFAVAVVPSDDGTLAQPARRDSALSSAQVMAMVRRAVDLIGGMASVVPDTARLVVLKPNVVAAKPSGSGFITDARVVRAAAILVHEAAPGARIVIAEGAGGWVSPALRDCTDVWVDPEQIVDGFEIAGYREVVAELRSEGFEVELFDLNFDRTYTLSSESDDPVVDDWDVAATVMDADVWINLPVAKTHGPKITCCLKNRFGILPGTVYGWSKSRGTPHHRSLPHAPRIIDEVLVDLWSLTTEDLCLVDAIAGSEGDPFEDDTWHRLNTVLVGRDAVATDLVAAQLMGFNPDDFEFADLAQQRGLGPGLIDRVEVLGARPESIAQRFEKAGAGYDSEWKEQATYGMGPRRWTLLGPLRKDHTFAEKEIAALSPVPGGDDWSSVVWFGHDKIDLDKRFEDPTNCAVYAFTYFRMTQSDSVRYWLGADEGLQVWIDGETIYKSSGRRRRRGGYRLGEVRLPGYLEAGEHRLLVRAEQGRGRFEFSFNICEPIDDERYAGNRYPGVRYYANREDPVRSATEVRAEEIWDWRADFPVSSESNLESPPPSLSADQLPEGVHPLATAVPVSGDLASLMLAAADLDGERIDDLTRRCLSEAPFGTTPIGFARERLGSLERYLAAGPGAERLAGWLGLRYDVTYGYRWTESLSIAREALVAGYPVVMGVQRGWRLVTGYRQEGSRTALREVGVTGAAWTLRLGDWWGLLPGRERANCPVILVAAASGTAVDALQDSVAALALEMAQYLPMEEESGEVVPVGLEAWDAWVREWEALPLDSAWAAKPWQRRQLARLRQRLAGLMAERDLAARYFDGAAQQAETGRQGSAFATAAAGYDGVVAALRDMRAALPQERWGDLTAADAGRLPALARGRALARRARDQKRLALAALADYLGQELPADRLGPSPEAKAQGEVQTLHVRTFIDGSDSIFIRGGELWYEHHNWDLPGKWGNRDLPTYVNEGAWRPEWEEGSGVSAAHTGWQPALPRGGLASARLIRSSARGMVAIVQEPGGDNDYTLEIRIDDEDGGAAWYDIVLEWQLEADE